MRAAHTFHLTLLQYAQQLHLQLQRHFTDFIQEYGAAVSEFQPALLLNHRSRKGAFFVAEQLALEQRF